MKNAHLALMLAVPFLCIPTAFAHANMLPEDASLFFVVTVWGLFFGIPTLLNAGIEAAAGFLYTRQAKKPARVLFWQFLANIFTFVPFLVVFNDNNGALQLLIAEAVIIAIEAVIIRVGGRKYMTWKDALLLSFIANLASIICGVVLNEFFLSFSR